MPKRFAAILAFAALFAGAVRAQEAPSPFALRAYSHARVEGGYRFDFTVANAGASAARAQGRLVVLNVYDTRQPKTLPIAPFDVPGGGEASFSAVWPDPPRLGQVRALLVVNDGVRPSLVESFGFWIVPWKEGLAALAALALLAALGIGLPRLFRYLRERVPSGMTAYIVEYDDTVMTLSSRFDVNWQDIVRANRLKPPYELQPGSRIFLPKHPLKRPSAPAKP